MADPAYTLRNLDELENTALRFGLAKLGEVRPARKALDARDIGLTHYRWKPGRRVGLVTNQTGVDSSGTKTRLLLRKAGNVRLVALFSPEHGIDGTVLAGKYVASRKDSLTNRGVCGVYALRGGTNKVAGSEIG